MSSIYDSGTDHDSHVLFDEMREPDRHYPLTSYIRLDGKTVAVSETVTYDAT